MAHDTYAQAVRANWPRPTCASCHAPCAYDREFRGSRLCQACYDTELLFTKRKELLCKT